MAKTQTPPAPDAEAPPADPFDQQQPPADEETPAGDGALFNAHDYSDPKLYLDQVDEKDVDKIRLDFSGSIMLDRRNPADVDFMRRLKLGSSHTLQVEAVCSSKKHGYTTGKEGDLDAIVYTGGLKVEDVYWPTPEDL